jgi:hypothetical protein
MQETGERTHRLAPPSAGASGVVGSAATSAIFSHCCDDRRWTELQDSRIDRTPARVLHREMATSTSLLSVERNGPTAVVTMHREPVNSMNLGGGSAWRAGARLIRARRLLDGAVEHTGPAGGGPCGARRTARAPQKARGDRLPSEQIRAVIFISGLKKNVFTAGTACRAGATRALSHAPLRQRPHGALRAQDVGAALRGVLDHVERLSCQVCLRARVPPPMSRARTDSTAPAWSPSLPSVANAPPAAAGWRCAATSASRRPTPLWVRRLFPARARRGDGRTCAGLNEVAIGIAVPNFWTKARASCIRLSHAVKLTCTRRAPAGRRDS